MDVHVNMFPAQSGISINRGNDPKADKIHNPNRAEKWKKFLVHGELCTMATELGKKAEAVQVATLLMMIGEEAQEIYAMFGNWENDGNNKKIKPVLRKFGEYYEPHRNSPFERFKFNPGVQEPRET